MVQHLHDHQEGADDDKNNNEEEQNNTSSMNSSSSSSSVPYCPRATIFIANSLLSKHSVSAQQMFETTSNHINDLFKIFSPMMKWMCNNQQQQNVTKFFFEDLCNRSRMTSFYLEERNSVKFAVSEAALKTLQRAF